MANNCINKTKDMTIENKSTYQIIKADDGMVLTEWKDGDDILNYSYAAKQYSPLTYDIAKLREITQEESDRLVNEQEEKIKEAEKYNNI